MPVNANLRILAITIFLLDLSAHAQNLTLLSADYGVEGNRIDVTCRVQSLVQNGY